eukprot:IDg11973t1
MIYASALHLIAPPRTLFEAVPPDLLVSVRVYLKGIDKGATARKSRHLLALIGNRMHGALTPHSLITHHDWPPPVIMPLNSEPAAPALPAPPRRPRTCQQCGTASTAQWRYGYNGKVPKTQNAIANAISCYSNSNACCPQETSSCVTRAAFVGVASTTVAPSAVDQPREHSPPLQSTNAPIPQ